VERGYRGDIVPEILFRYRQRQDSMSSVNFAGHGHARLYGQLVARHPESFSRHLKHLVVRRNADMAAAWALSDTARERLELDALPALARARDDVVEAERRHSRWEREREIEQQRQQLAQEVAALRASLSWRLTAPLRSVGTLVNRALRRQP
jgi:hypothetical protein